MAQSRYDSNQGFDAESFIKQLQQQGQIRDRETKRQAALRAKIEQEYFLDTLNIEVEHAISTYNKLRDIIVQNHAEAYQKATDAYVEALQQHDQAKADSCKCQMNLIEKQIEREVEVQLEGNRRKIQETTEAKLKAEQAVIDEIAKIEAIADKNRWKTSTIWQRKKILDKQKYQIIEKKTRLQDDLQLYNAERTHINSLIREQKKKLVDTQEGSEEQRSAQEQLEQLELRKANISEQIRETKARIADATEIEQDLSKKSLENTRQIQAAENAQLTGVERYNKAKERRKELELELKKIGLDDPSDKEAIKKRSLELNIDPTELEESMLSITEELDRIAGSIGDDYKAAKKERKDAQKNKENQPSIMAGLFGGDDADVEDKEAADEWSKENKQAAVNATQNAVASQLNAIDSNIESFFEYQASINARLQGANKSYQDMVNMVQKNVGISGVTSSKEVLANIKKLVDSGVAYDVEARAYLATMSEEITNSFDAFDANLMRMIRLQQSDITAARLGMEAALLTFFNENFKDSSYLTDGFDQVTAAIFDASAQLSREESLAFEYMTQKWMGALYSLGLSQETTGKIAEGLNYLGTGNVDALNSNESLQTLFAMSASNAGISYADILTQGLDADTTNKLLRSMVEYLSSIASNTENQVTKSAYANLFGLSVTDMKTIATLSSTDIQGIYDSALDYTSAVNETAYQLSQVASRTHLSQIVDTAFENAMATSSISIGNNIAGYATWKVLNVVEELTGGIALPFVNVMGFGVDLNTSVTQLAKTGIAGLGLMGGLLSSLFGGSLFGTADLSKWGYQEFNSRGGQIRGISKGVSSGTSASSEMMGSASSSDIKNSTLSEGATAAEEDSKITNESTADQAEETKDYTDNVLAALGWGETTIIEEVTSMHEHLNEGMGRVQELLSLPRVFKTSGGIDTFQSDLLTILNSVDRTTQETNSMMFASVASTMLSTVGDYARSTYIEDSSTIVQSAVEFANAALSTVTTTKDLSSMMYNTDVLDMSATRVAIEALEQQLTESKANSISNLDAINTVLAQEVSAQEIGSAMTQKVQLEDISQTLRDSLTSELRSLIATALTDAFISKLSGSEDEADTLLSSMIQRLSTTTFTVDLSDNATAGIGQAVAQNTPGSPFV